MIGAAIRKDIRLVFADRNGLLALFAMPVVFMAVFGLVFSSDDGATKEQVVAVYAIGPTAERVAAAVDQSPMFTAKRVESADEVRRQVAKRRVSLGLILPADFDPMSDRPGELSADMAASPAIRGPIHGALSSLVARTAFQLGDKRILVERSPPGLRPAVARVDGFQVSVPGNAVLFGFFLALTVALSFVEDRRSGAWRRMLASPIRPGLLVASKLVPYVLIGCVQLAFLFGFGFLFLGLESGGSIASLVILSLCVVICAVGLGLLMASFGGSEKQIGGAGSISLLVMGLLGGAMIPRLAMPETMQKVGLATPHGWALDGYYEVLLRKGTTLLDVAPACLALLGFAAAFSLIGAWRFRWT